MRKMGVFLLRTISYNTSYIHVEYVRAHSLLENMRARDNVVNTVA